MTNLKKYIKIILYSVLLGMLAIWISTGIMILLGYPVFPKIANCRVCEESVFVWNHRVSDYRVKINNKDTNTFSYDEGAIVVYIRGYVHNDCTKDPVVNVKMGINDMGNPYFDAKCRHNEAMKFKMLSPMDDDGKISSGTIAYNTI
jgi:hypothetical protein